MSTRIEKFSGQSPVDPESARKLDRNFARLAVENIPHVNTTTVTLTSDDTIASVQANATLAAITVYLPLSPTGSRRRTITKTDASANAVTVSGNGHNINGAATYALAAQYASVTVEPTGTTWLVVASYP